MATIHLRRGEHQVAVEHFRNLLARDPQALRLHLGLAAALEGMGDTAAATAVYKRVREMYPNLPADLKVLPPSVAAD